MHSSPSEQVGRVSSWYEYGEWHLGLTEGANEDSKASYAFIYGDLRRLHRTGIIACHYRAAEWRRKRLNLRRTSSCSSWTRRAGEIEDRVRDIDQLTENARLEHPRAARPVPGARR
jgi:hypothetical protein